MTLAPRSMDVTAMPEVLDSKPGAPGWIPGGTGALFESIVINANDVVLVTEAEPVDLASGGPRVLYVNPAFTRMTGYTAAEIVGLTPRILQSPKTDRRELDRLRAALSRWKPVEVELLNVRKDGTEFWVQINITPVCDATGLWTHWVAVQRDITARKGREAAVTAMLENTSDVMLVVDAAGMLTDASPSCLRLLQFSSAELIGLPVSRLVHPNDLDQLHSVLAPVTGLRHGPRAATELRLRQQDGGWLWVAVDGSELDPEAGGRVLLSCPDISSRKQAEAELQAMHGRFRGAFDDAPIGMALSLPSG